MAMSTPDPNSNVAGLYLIPVCILASIALTLVILRIYTRLRRTSTLYVDDWLILVAEVLSLTSVLLGACAAAYGWGRPIGTLTPDDLVRSLKLNFAMQTVWIITLCLVRLSVACSLLRFGRELWWRGILYTILGLQTLISSSYIVIQFGQCTPVASNWAQVPSVRCWPVQPIIDYGWVIAAVYVAMDLILSLLPIHLIRSLSRSTSEKILICVLMSLGLLATAVAGAKMSTFNDFGKGDPMQATIKPSMLAKLEELVGIIATCLPCLKGPVEGRLKSIGLLKPHQLTRPSFVNTVSLLQVPKNTDGEIYGDSPTKIDEIRIDSVNVNTNSDASSLTTRKGSGTCHAV